MRRAAALLLLSISLTADAGVAQPGAAAEPCPAVIKNAVTLDMLMSDSLPPDVCLACDGGGADTVNAVTAADTSALAVAPEPAGRSGGLRETGLDTAVAVKTVADADTVKTGVVTDTVKAIKTAAAYTGEDAARKPSRVKRNMKFGRRAAFNQSQASNVVVRVYTHDGESFLCTDYRDRPGFGIGFEAAGVIELFFSEALALNFSPGAAFLKPVNTAVLGTSEVGLSFPLLLEWGPFGAFKPRAGSTDVFAGARGGGFDFRRLRLSGGVWAGAPLFSWVKWNGEESAPFKERAAADFGLAGGVGIYVSDRAFIDARVIFGLTGYDRTDGRRLNQAAIGVNYVK